MKHVRISDLNQPVPVHVTITGTRRRIAGDHRYWGAPDETPPGGIEPWEAVYPVRPDTAHSRSLRFLDVAGEFLSAVAIIAGGVFAYGFMPPL